MTGEITAYQRSVLRFIDTLIGMKIRQHNPRVMLPKKVVKEERKPGFVPYRSYPLHGDDHSSRTAVADGLKQPDPGTSDGPPSNVPLFGLAPDGVYRASDVTAGTGELLPHPFTLTHHS